MAKDTVLTRSKIIRKFEYNIFRRPNQDLEESDNEPIILGYIKDDFVNQVETFIPVKTHNDE